MSVVKFVPLSSSDVVLVVVAIILEITALADDEQFLSFRIRVLDWGGGNNPIIIFRRRRRFQNLKFGNTANFCFKQGVSR